MKVLVIYSSNLEGGKFMFEDYEPIEPLENPEETVSFNIDSIGKRIYLIETKINEIIEVLNALMEPEDHDDEDDEDDGNMIPIKFSDVNPQKPSKKKNKNV